jgi:hypothetical protein
VAVSRLDHPGSGNDVSSAFISSFLFDRELWDLIPNEQLVDVVLDHFADCSALLENIELFLATVILKNPQNSNIVTRLFQFHFSESKCRLAVLIKTHAIAILVQNDVTDAHPVLLKAFIHTLSTETLVDVFPFPTLQMMLLAARGALAAGLYELLVHIALKTANYITKDPRGLLFGRWWVIPQFGRQRSALF